MESTGTFVIKVNCGDMLRRFSVPINVNGQLDLEMAGLRAKTISFFSLPSDAELSLTYIDEDGDVVTLVDDNDLRDVMKQNLKFLRIDVKLNGSVPSDSSARASSGSSSPHAQDPLKNIRKGVNDTLMAMPEALLEIISKLSVDLASKAVMSSPVVGEILECFSKLEQQASRPQESGSSEPAEPNVSRDGGLPAKSNSKGPSAPWVNLNLAPPFDSKGPFGGDGIHNERKPVNLDGSTSSADHKTSHSPNTSGFGAGISNECPFSGIPVNNDSNPMPFYMYPRMGQTKKSHNSDYRTSIGFFHKGIRCDGCGALPIAGPRFKSKVKEDYDLCSICFSKIGNEMDYIRMDRPVSVRHVRSFRGLCSPAQNPWLNHPPPSCAQGGLNFRLGNKSKLDSRFILDVNVLDGTVMAPSTPFTKIWRLRNNGSLVWPRGTQLFWIGGDNFSDSVSVEIEIPEDGVPINRELDVAVDFTAPQLPGRYISYWRMSSPSGAKFGQRVWVLIHVDASLKDSVCNGFQGLDFHASPDNSSSKGFVRINVNGESGCSGSPNVFTDTVNLVSPENSKSNESETPINSGLPVLNVHVNGATYDPQVLASSTVSFVDFIELNPVETSCEASSVKDVPISSEVDNGNKDVEQAMLKELEEMGFKQIDLNKDILRKNEYNLDQSVDALCGFGDWDPILEELQEMGFCDEETNQRLLKKNNGSIKRVVMDLLTGDKTQV